MALLQIAIGAMTQVHPVYISDNNSTLRLIGQDFLERLKSILCFQTLELWPEGHKPHQISLPEEFGPRFYAGGYRQLRDQTEFKNQIGDIHLRDANSKTVEPNT